MNAIYCLQTMMKEKQFQSVLIYEYFDLDASSSKFQHFIICSLRAVFTWNIDGTY